MRCKNPSGAPHSLSSLVFELRWPRALCFYQDLCCWISASDPPSLLYVRQPANSESTCVLQKPKEAPSKWVRGNESWEKEFELCFTSGARSSGFVWEVPSAAWHISSGEQRTRRLDYDKDRLYWKSGQNSSVLYCIGEFIIKLPNYKTLFFFL